ncbi:MAG: beta-lactamase family protein [Granulosicoccus sp.]|nr:beta-lactamase family protein [Granulosicoccus sp.]
MLEHYDVPGVSIALIKDFEIERLLVYGVKSQNTQAPVRTDTLFQAASISKAVAAVAALKMSQDGVIDLDEDINNELISWTVEDNQYTQQEKVNLRRLLSHTAGTTVHGFAGYNNSELVPTMQQILNGEAPANSPAVVVSGVPGNRFSYSGGGYVIAQQALVDVTQQSFADMMRETVLAPLAMTSSSFNQDLSQESVSRVSAGHNFHGQNIPGDYHLYPEMSAAGLWTTPEDLAKLLIELQLSLRNESNKVLAGNVIEEMLTPVGGPVFNTANEFYGLGFSLWKQGDEFAFGHGGANAGFRAKMQAHKTAGTGYVVMTNGENGDAVIQAIESLIEKTESQDPSQF